MENQMNAIDQNAQQIGQNPINQQPISPEKPKINYWKFFTILFACLFFGVLGIYIFSLSSENRPKYGITAPPDQEIMNNDTASPTMNVGKFAYLKTTTDEGRGPGEIVVSDFNGATKTNIHTVPIWVGPYSGHDVSNTNETFVYSSFIEKDQYGNDIESYLWVSKKGSEPRKILTLENKKYIESPVISADGQKIAYALITEHGQLWTVNSDGTNSTLVIDRTYDYLEKNSRFRLAPVAWSYDNTKIYMQTTSDSEATPVGMYVANLLTGKIEKANTPQITLWGLSFSPDKTNIAYTTFAWKDIPDNRPQPGPPFTLSVMDINTGVTKKILESQTDQFNHPVWSSDGSKIAVGKTVDGIDQEIYVVDINSKSMKLIATGTRSGRLNAWSWLSDTKLIYTEESYTTGVVPTQVTSYLFTINIDGTDKQKIDSARNIVVLGALQ